MELKYFKKKFNDLYKFSSNRTFMELKLLITSSMIMLLRF